MASVTTNDGVALYYEEAGDGDAIVFVHEFSADHRSWEPQMRFFSRYYRCITFAARGYPPSDIPESAESYSQERAADDIADVVRGLGLSAAHIVGLSMGATSALEFGIRHPASALSITAVGGGGGASTDPARKRAMTEDCLSAAVDFEKLGAPAIAEVHSSGPVRVQFRKKDPRGWLEFKTQFAEGSAKGHARTLVGVQSRRIPIYEREADLARLAAPVLIVVGDEDSTLDASIFLKRVIPRCGLLTLPKTGHTVNLEEPDFFNAFLLQFLHAVEHDHWGERDPVNREKWHVVPPKK